MEIRYQKTTNFQKQDGTSFVVTEMGLESGSIVINRTDKSEVFLKTFFDFKEQEKRRFAALVYQTFPEYLLEPTTFSPPLCIEKFWRNRPFFVSKVSQDEYATTILFFTGLYINGRLVFREDAPNKIPSWLVPLEAIRELKNADYWSKGWEV